MIFFYQQRFKYFFGKNTESADETARNSREVSCAPRDVEVVSDDMTDRKCDDYRHTHTTEIMENNGCVGFVRV